MVLLSPASPFILGSVKGLAGETKILMVPRWTFFLLTTNASRVLPRLKTKAELVGVVWAEFVTTSNIHQRKSSVEGIGGHSAERA